MTRLARACILPPDLLARVARDSNADDRVSILDTLELDHSFRQARAVRAAQHVRRTLAVPTTPDGPTLHRTIYDKHGDDTETSLGTMVRSEGQPPVGDASVNQAYDSFGYTIDLYWNVFHRNSIDDQGEPVIGLVHFGENYDNAFWDGNGHMFFGDGDGQLLTDTTKGIDVIGHELTHGVTQNEANLAYSGQSGALNESISDVFGSLVKQYHLQQSADQADWLIGADIVGPKLAPALRSMKDPGHANPYDNQPADMDGYVQTQSDNGGVHTNSGIPNRAFYVVATTIGGNSWEAAGQIWYDTLSDARLKPTARFSTFAALTVANAQQRYGAASSQADAVRAGWDAVKVPVR